MKHLCNIVTANVLIYVFPVFRSMINVLLDLGSHQVTYLKGSIFTSIVLAQVLSLVKSELDAPDECVK